MTIERVDVGRRRIAVDVVQWLEGEEARKAYLEETGDDRGPPNDYLVRNTNPKVRTLAVAEHASVRLVRLLDDSSADLDEGTFEELPSYVPTSSGIFWISLESEVVVDIEEQYRP